jgi:hypothetical protein
MATDVVATLTDRELSKRTRLTGDAAEIPKWDPEGDRVYLPDLSH